MDADQGEYIGLVSGVAPACDHRDAGYETVESGVGDSRIGAELTKHLLWSTKVGSSQGGWGRWSVWGAAKL